MTVFAPESPDLRARADGSASPEQDQDDLDLDVGPRELGRHSLGYSRFVGMAKILLAAAAAGLMIALFLWPADEPPPPMPSGVTVQQGQMVRPRYSGVDEKNRDYYISADAALQPKADAEAIQLNRPEGDIAIDGGWLSLRAKNGRYERTGNMVSLNEGFEIFHDAGYRLTGQDIRVDLTKAEASSQSPVDLFGPTGEVHAKGGLLMQNSGAIVIFKGPARAVLRGEAR